MLPPSSTIANNEPLASAPKRGPLWWSILRGLGRLLVIAGLAWGGLSVFGAWNDLLSPSVAPTLERSEPEGLPDLAANMVGGSWRLGGHGPPLGLAFLPEAVARARVLSFAVDESKPIETLETTNLVPLLQGLAGPGRSFGTLQEYSLEKRGLLLKAFTRGVGEAERLVGGRLALRGDSQRGWLTLETTSRSGQPEIVGASIGFPALPERGSWIALRSNDRGSWIGGLAAVEAFADDLVNQWRRQGWSVMGTRPAPSGGEPGPPWLCQNALESVKVWASEGGGAGPLLLLFVSETPTVAREH